MHHSPNTAEFQRLQYWQGQRLRSSDFQDQLAISAQLQWWHNRSLHNTFGLVHPNPLERERSMTVELSADDKSVIVHSGLAYDAFGRALIHLYPQVIEIPQSKQSITLLVRYKSESASVDRRDLAAACLPEPIAAMEALEFVWLPSERFGVRDGVPLAQLRCVDSTTQAVRKCSENELPSLDIRFIPPISRAIARPRIGSGVTVPGKTAWKVWNFKINEVPFPLGFQVQIDTSAAGFTETPCYFAWLQGSFWHFEEKPVADRRSLRQRKTLPPLEQIDQTSVDGFTFRIWLPEVPILGSDEGTNPQFEHNFLNLALTQKLYISWIGIQSDQDATQLQGEHHGTA